MGKRTREREKKIMNKEKQNMIRERKWCLRDRENESDWNFLWRPFQYFKNDFGKKVLNDMRISRKKEKEKKKVVSWKKKKTMTWIKMLTWKFIKMCIYKFALFYLYFCNNGIKARKKKSEIKIKSCSFFILFVFSGSIKNLWHLKILCKLQFLVLMAIMIIGACWWKIFWAPRSIGMSLILE